MKNRTDEIWTAGREEVALPARYARLSKSGDVLIRITDGGTSVLFFTFSGVLDNFSGYAYSSENS
jgi:hypothetical protein